MSFSEVPALAGLPRRWRRAPRRWGHPLHSVCSYFAMFPPQIAHVFVRWLTAPGDVVYDPFSGRGTVALEAAILGREAVGADANPLAVALTSAKVHIPSVVRAQRRLRELRAAFRDGDFDAALAATPPEIRMLYSDATLRQLLYLRARLRAGHPVDSLLLALTLGMLHANHQGGKATRGFSISMPNTFAMSPRYVERYIAEHGLVAPDIDAFTMLGRRVEMLELPAKTACYGRALLHDATEPPPAEIRGKAKLIFTSPPYLQVIQYGKYNWVRLWFLGHEWRDVDSKLTMTSSLERYLEFIGGCLDSMREAVVDDGFVGLVIGDVRRPGGDIELGHVVRDRVALPRGWHCHGVIVDRVPGCHKVSRIWKSSRGRATKTDRIVLLSPQPCRLPALERIRWLPPAFRNTKE